MERQESGLDDRDTRLIKLNRIQSDKFCDNKISTSKYNLVSFFPRFLIEQFRRYANIFFLVIALLQQIPDVSPTGRYTTAFPLVVILTVSALKELFEDVKRHRADHKVNRTRVKLFRSGAWLTERWMNVRVGDVVKVENNQPFPADLVLLSSSEPQAMAYIETSNLDGETNLKIRQGHPFTADLRSHDGLNALNGEVECEAPNRHLYEFHGNLRLTNKTPVPLGPDQVLLRGARLTNTRWVFAVVIYTGHETKLIMNSRKAPLKRSNVDVVTNRQILVLFGALMGISIVSAIGAQIWEHNNVKSAWYMGFTKVDTTNFGRNLLTFAILYNNLIPISLQVTLEMVRFFQASYINNDIDMYHEETDTPAVARTSNLNEELGQVKYLMTDKTGTLTENVMVFKKCSIAGTVYGSDDPNTHHFVDQSLLTNLKGRHITAAIIREFLVMMAVCHTVVPEKSDDGETINYQASSPDENALVNGASDLGFVFHTRVPDSVTINVLGKDETYDVLHVLEFTSLRKRMSVIVKTPDGHIKLFCKGADSAIFERLGSDQFYTDSTGVHLETFANSGYRTLCFAKADIPPVLYDGWRRGFYEASIAINNREDKMAAQAELIEKNLSLLGATAIEDKLQQGVPETIAALLKADIKIWVLTGDKRETAINIGHSCRLLSPNMPIMIIEKNTYEDTKAALTRYLEDLGPQHLGKENDIALVIDGNSLRHALTGEARRDFFDLATSCRSVICCRTSPMQKAEVVELVRQSNGDITLAIGDGANDVAMIQAAHVGIGITGQEGLQAASASDYTIAQFRFLARLLFVHGAWNFHRTVKVILYSFYKNICLYIIELWFAIYSAWSGQALFERWTIGLFNVLFTAAPPIAIGLFDRTASAETMLKNPALYKLSQDRNAFSVKVFYMWIGLAVLHSVMLYFLTMTMLQYGVAWEDGRLGGWLMLGNCVYSYVVVTVCLKAALETDAWTWLTHVAIWGSIANWIIFLPVYSLFWPTLPFAADMVGMGGIVMGSPLFWLGLLLIPVTTLLVDFVYKVVRRTVFKTIADEVRELEWTKADPAEVLQRLTGRSVPRSLRFWRKPTLAGRQILLPPYRYGALLQSDVARTAINNNNEDDDLATDADVTLPNAELESLLVDYEVGAAEMRAATDEYRLATTSSHVGAGDDAVAYSRHVSDPVGSQNRLSETARLLRNVFRRSTSGATLAQEARHGYAFSQEEHGAVGQENMIRQYNSNRAKPEGL